MNLHFLYGSFESYEENYDGGYMFMKKLFAVVLVFILFALTACGGGSEEGRGGRADTLTFQQIRDNDTGVVFALGDSLADFEAAFGEGEFVSEGVVFIAQARTQQRTYTFLDERIMVGFIDDGQTARRIDLTATPEDVDAARFETFEFGVGTHVDDLVGLQGFSNIALRGPASGAVRILNAEGEIRTGVGLVRVGSYSTAVFVEDDVAVRIIIEMGGD